MNISMTASINICFVYNTGGSPQSHPARCPPIYFTQSVCVGSRDMQVVGWYFIDQILKILSDSNSDYKQVLDIYLTEP